MNFIPKEGWEQTIPELNGSIILYNVKVGYLQFRKHIDSEKKKYDYQRY